MPLTLATPERAAPAKDLEIRPKQVKAWIDSLPLAQSMDSARKMGGHLAALNRSKIDTDDRLSILETYRPITGTLLEEMEAIYGKATLPLAPRPREALEMARSLAGEMGTGYKIVLAEKSGKLIAFGAKKLVTFLLLRIMQCQCARLNAGYKSYTAAPPGTWAEIHQVFLQAERDGIVGEPADPETRGSIAELYCEALLLSLTDPYRLSPGEADKVIAQVRASRAGVTLSQVRPQTRPGGHFLVPCDTDKPPKPALSANDETGGPNWRLFDANPIVEKLRARKNALQSGNVSATTSRSMGPDGVNLLGKLITLWGDPPKRSSRREPMDTTVAICVGIKAVHHFLSLEPHTRPGEGEAIREGITMPLLAIPDDEVSRSMHVLEWDVVNQSEGGVKVRRTGATDQLLSVGEVLGLRFVGRIHWAVGVVRWLTALEDGGLEFGVQFLASEARNIELAPSIGAGLPQAKPALLLLDDHDPGAEHMVLAANNTFSELREFHVEDQDQVSLVRARGLIEKTPRFDLFHVSAS